MVAACETLGEAPKQRSYAPICSTNQIAKLVIFDNEIRAKGGGAKAAWADQPFTHGDACMLKYVLSAVVLLIVSAGPSLANEDADKALRQRKLEQYALSVAEKYPAKQAYFLNNKTVVGQGLADEVYAVLKKQGGEAVVYAGYNRGDNLSEKDYQHVEKADVFFCGCTDDEAGAINAAVLRQGFRGQFVALTDPK